MRKRRQPDTPTAASHPVTQPCIGRTTMSVINTNITSLIGQHNLSKSQSALQTAMERLSSGLRINSAKDDAAGQAIANRMTAQLTGLAQAQRNANDGISLAQTAEGSLGQINDNVQRIRELTVQALNGTNSTEDLQSIQDEIDERLAEITRISEQTDFNGVAVLGGEAGDNINLNIQVGAKDDQVITIAYNSINLEYLEQEGFFVTGGCDAATATAADVLELADDGATVTLGEDADAVEYTKQADGSWQYEDEDGNGQTISASALADLIAAEDDAVDVGDYTIAADGSVTADDGE